MFDKNWWIVCCVVRGRFDDVYVCNLVVATVFSCVSKARIHVMIDDQER